MPDEDTVMFLFLYSLCTTVSTQVGFSASACAYSHKYPATTTHRHTHTLAVHTTWAASFKRRWLRHVLQYRGVALPLWSMIRELCCTQIELSEQLPFNPPFHTKNTQPHYRVTVEQSDKHKMELMRGTGAWGAKAMIDEISVGKYIYTTSEIS